MLFKGNQSNKVVDIANDLSIENFNEIDIRAIGKINALADSTIQRCSSVILKGTKIVRLQSGAHGGSNVYFNKDGSDTRFGLVDGVNGAMYAAYDYLTAMKEIFQYKISMRESDLANYYMGELVIETDLQIMQISALLTRTSIQLHDVTTSQRCVTQRLAKRVQIAGMNGIEFNSNVTSKRCLVLWHHEPSGYGIVSTASQTTLDKLTINGEDVADILVYRLNISVED